MPSAPPCVQAKLPTAIATRYDDILGVVENRTVCWCGRGPATSDTTLPFEMAMSPRGTVRVTANVALNAGSSNDGKARRASVDSNCVTAYFRLLPWLR